MAHGKAIIADGAEAAGANGGGGAEVRKLQDDLNKLTKRNAGEGVGRKLLTVEKITEAATTPSKSYDGTGTILKIVPVKKSEEN